MGVYLCRKNFAVAAPLIRDAFELSREDVGAIASISTFAYLAGKFIFGPVIDRVGGRRAFLLSLFFVGVFGVVGGMANTLSAFTLAYSLNRFAGSAAWGAMVKQVPGWFRSQSVPIALAVLSLSFVFGGALATVLAGAISSHSGNNWRWIMSGPSLVMFAILAVCAAFLPRTPQAPSANKPTAGTAITLRDVRSIVGDSRFRVVCALSFTLTLLREAFNVWTVDFFLEAGLGQTSISKAALLSAPFDICGAVGILAVGWMFGRIDRRRRGWLLCGMLLTLSALVASLPDITSRSYALAAVWIGAIGLLVYGPYSLLAGVMSVELRGERSVATVAGIVDGVGYLAGILAGAQFGRIVDIGGYRLGFACLAGLAGVSAALSVLLYRLPSATREGAEGLQEKRS